MPPVRDALSVALNIMPEPEEVEAIRWWVGWNHGQTHERPAEPCRICGHTFVSHRVRREIYGPDAYRMWQSDCQVYAWAPDRNVPCECRTRAPRNVLAAQFVRWD